MNPIDSTITREVDEDPGRADRRSPELEPHVLHPETRPDVPQPPPTAPRRGSSIGLRRAHGRSVARRRAAAAATDEPPTTTICPIPTGWRARAPRRSPAPCSPQHRHRLRAEPADEARARRRPCSPTASAACRDQAPAAPAPTSGCNRAIHSVSVVFSLKCARAYARPAPRSPSRSRASAIRRSIAAYHAPSLFATSKPGARRATTDVL